MIEIFIIVFQFIWAIVKGFAQGLWENPVLIAIIIGITTFGWIKRKIAR